MPEMPRPKRMKMHDGPDFQQIEPDADLTDQQPECIDRSDGVHLCPAVGVRVSMAGQQSAPRFVTLSLERFGRALYVNFTPEGARSIASAMLKNADELEAAQQNAANAQLAATLAKGKPA